MRYFVEYRRRRCCRSWYGSDPRPNCLSPDTVELVKQSLATGCSDLLVRAGGWRRERFIGERNIVAGRLWERREPQMLGLSFSEHSLEFLIWLTAANVSEPKQRWRPTGDNSLTLGDQLLLFLTYQALRNTEIASRWCKLAPFRDHGLCLLAFADDWGEQKVDRTLNRKPWVEGHCSLDDIVRANRYLTFQFSGQGAAAANGQNDRELFFPAEVFREFQRLVKTLVREDRIFVSDRKLVKLYKLFRVRAWLLSGGTVSRDDLRLLAHLGETHAEMALLRDKVPLLLGE